jgi:DNA-binding transcriptional ArsR family regulator
MKREFSELHQTLTTMLILSEHPDGLTADDLMTGMEVSRATLSRKIAEARHLGAKIESVRQGRRNIYRLANWTEIKKTVTRWIELEEQRTLTAPIDPDDFSPRAIEKRAGLSTVYEAMQEVLTQGRQNPPNSHD